MIRIIKHLCKYWYSVLIVIALLFVQAYCDLSLPEYTSRIVNTGIQEGGIEDNTHQKQFPKVVWKMHYSF